MRYTTIFLVYAACLAGCSGDSGPKIGPPAAIAVVSGNAQTAEVNNAIANPLVVRVTDAQGAGVPNTPVTWTASAGSVAATNSTTDATGTAQARWTLGTIAGPMTATASFGGGVTAGFNATAAPGPVNAVTVTAPVTSILVGDRVQLSAGARDAYTNVISGKTYTWSSSNPNAATVDGNGNVLGTGAGSANVSAAADGKTGSLTLTVTAPQMTIVVENKLWRPVTVSANGAKLGTVNAGATSQFTGPRTALQISFTLNRQTTTSGREVGETMSGVFSTIQSPAATETFIIHNRIGSDLYFAPFMDNRTAVPWLMVVNFGLPAENRCDCVVPAFTADVNIGYYRYFSNSNVRAYRDVSNYTGNYIYWDILSSWVGDRSHGGVDLWATTVLNNTGVAAARRVFLPAMSELLHVHDDIHAMGTVPVHRANMVGWRQTVAGPPTVFPVQPADR